MANEEHLNILKQGVKAWNQWRKEHPEIKPDLRGAYLSGANLGGMDLSAADLSGMYVSGARLIEADLSGAYLSRANLFRADLSGAHLGGASLRGTNLCGADLSATNLRDANLVEADLRGAYLSGANLSKANLIEADLTDARMGWTMFGDVDLSVVKGLTTVRHTGPSTIGIDTIYRSKGNIPEVFLREAGVPEDFITYMASLAGQAIQFYSCFISYSSNDQDFADRLYADLQAKNVRCWFAPEDMRVGDRIRDRIDGSIRMYDKLLLILSEHSIASQWVEQEVEAALEKERKQGQTVLFPIRLDDTAMEIESGWPALIRNTRHIGDFRDWKDHDAYQKAFTRLLRDLEAEEAKTGT